MRIGNIHVKDILLTPSLCDFHLGSWDIGEWSECSKTCGLGMQQRQVLCRQIYANRTLNVHTSRCRHLERPEVGSTCQMKICSEWQIRSEWTAVSGSFAFDLLLLSVPNACGRSYCNPVYISLFIFAITVYHKYIVLDILYVLFV